MVPFFPIGSRNSLILVPKSGWGITKVASRAKTAFERQAEIEEKLGTILRVMQLCNLILGFGKGSDYCGIPTIFVKLFLLRFGN